MAQTPPPAQDINQTVPVNIDNFLRAETDYNFQNKVDLVGFGKIGHLREPVSIDNQPVVRVNRDTLFSFGIFDLTSPVTITMPNSNGRFMSLLVINEDHYIKDVIYDPGDHTLTQEKIGTRYAQVAFRTLVNPEDPADVKAAHEMQDQITWQQANPGRFELPNWDEASRSAIQNAVLALGSYVPDSRRMFGDKDEVDEVRHLIGTAGGFGGNPEYAALYLNYFPTKNDGRTAYVLAVPVAVPVDGFWSVSLYNAEGYFQKNSQNAYSFNNLTAKKNSDGSITIHFGGDPNQPNYLPILPGWNYTVRLYRPREELLDGSWKFPDAEPG
jgi:hypothetical protein